MWRHDPDVLAQIARRLLGMLASHYKQHRKDRRELQMQIFNNTGDLHVENGCVTVRLNYLASLNQAQAMEELCNNINQWPRRGFSQPQAMNFTHVPHPVRFPVTVPTLHHASSAKRRK
ncbi:MAG: hypothetical protein O3B01_31100 [Planctomycetota bacterium]|nr:hypothetical protein [Planctomycetota bacterium]MDA1143030.1 hypothetical protein [Planctomycetota bacterium]